MFLKLVVEMEETYFRFHKWVVMSQDVIWQSVRIKDAQRFFDEENAEGRFIASDVFLLKDLEHQFDLIICHDVIEHIMDKKDFIHKCKSLLNSGG